MEYLTETIIARVTSHLLKAGDCVEARKVVLRQK